MNIRKQLSDATHIVIKLGSGILTNKNRQPDLPQMTHLIRQMSELRNRGKEVILVSSGAVAAGCGVLGFQEKPKDLDELQACAAVGQLRLMSIYENLFSIYHQNIAQILLTHDDMEDTERCVNARNTIRALVDHKIIPIINENDTVSVEELKFGDNDRLSALVAALVPADLLILLTTVDGFMKNYGTPEQEMIHTVKAIDESVLALAGGTNSATAVGGMKTKLMAAQIAFQSGVAMIIAPGRQKDVIDNIFAGKEIGTLFIPETHGLSGRKKRIAFFHHTRGILVVDQGARKALVERGKSLLFPGIRSIKGNFEEGDVVSIRDTDNKEFARGIVEVSSERLNRLEIPEDEVVHRNNMVLFVQKDKESSVSAE